MKYLTPGLLLIFILVLYSSCYKANNGQQTSIPTFNIFLVGSNISDSVVTITVNDSSTFSLPLSFSLVSGNPENYPVSCFINGLPNGVTITSPDTATFKLNYDINFNLSVNTDTGVYLFQVNTLTSSGLNTYKMRLHVIPPLAKSGYDTAYYGEDFCFSSSGNFERLYVAEISTDGNNAHQILIYDFFGDYVVYANIIGTYPSAIIKLPLQNAPGDGSASVVSPTMIYGTGFSAPDTGSLANNKPMIFINDTIVIAGDTETCQTNLKPHP